MAGRGLAVTDAGAPTHDRLWNVVFVDSEERPHEDVAAAVQLDHRSGRGAIGKPAATRPIGATLA
jgi:hypothetical protein